MTLYTFREIVAYGRKAGTCEVCGKRATRSRQFTNTVSPFNRNADGSVRTEQEIREHVRGQAREWEATPVQHARCES